MKTLKELYRIGRGPSSSHTMGPQHAAEIFLERCSDAAKYVVTLYGSLAATGKGHMTDQAIGDVLKGHGQLEIRWEPQTFLPYHPNGMRFQAYDSQQNLLNDWTVFSVGGGALSEGKGFDKFGVAETYAYPNLTEIMKWCYDNGRNYWEYVEMCEQKDIWDYLGEVWNAMKQSISNGLTNEGVLPGPLKLPRKAANYYTKATSYKPLLQERSLIYAYALAVSEENASGGTVVTAPTCGSCGVMPAVAAAAACQLLGGSQSQIEYAAEMGLEHHLGMTCDPMCGMVQIPCIERNAFAASRAIDVAQFALQSDGHHHVSYDKIVKVMKQTGHDLPSLYKETSQGGMASLVEDI